MDCLGWLLVWFGGWCCYELAGLVGFSWLFTFGLPVWFSLFSSFCLRFGWVFVLLLLLLVADGFGCAVVLFGWSGAA